LRLDGVRITDWKKEEKVVPPTPEDTPHRRDITAAYAGEIDAKSKPPVKKEAAKKVAAPAEAEKKPEAAAPVEAEKKPEAAAPAEAVAPALAQKDKKEDDGVKVENKKPEQSQQMQAYNAMTGHIRKDGKEYNTMPVPEN